MENDDRAALTVLLDALQALTNRVRDIDHRVTALRGILWTVASEVPDRMKLQARLRDYARLQNEVSLGSPLLDSELQLLRQEIERFADQL